MIEMSSIDLLPSYEEHSNSSSPVDLSPPTYFPLAKLCNARVQTVPRAELANIELAISGQDWDDGKNEVQKEARKIFIVAFIILFLFVMTWTALALDGIL